MKKFPTLMLLGLFSMNALGAKDAKLDAATKIKGSTNLEAVKSQKKIDRLADQTQDMLLQYRQTLKKIENAKIYNAQLEKIIAQQIEEKSSIATQIDSLKETNQGIFPLMLKMVDTLKQFVALDVPFLPEEREKRIVDLTTLMDRADISTSEKFRRVLEAYQVENEYGRTIEAYRGIQKRDGKDLTVDFLRVGRVALIYQSLDGKIAALWDKKTAQWVDLGSEYKRSIREGLAMARKQRAPQLIKLPLGAVGGQI